jgi:hypothetical protein
VSYQKQCQELINLKKKNATYVIEDESNQKEGSVLEKLKFLHFHPLG